MQAWLGSNTSFLNQVFSREVKTCTGSVFYDICCVAAGIMRHMYVTGRWNCCGERACLQAFRAVLNKM